MATFVTTFNSRCERRSSRRRQVQARAEAAGHALNQWRPETKHSGETERDMTVVSLKSNGKAVEIDDLDPLTPLLWVLRCAWPCGRKIRLRRRILRCVYGACRRRSNSILPDSRIGPRRTGNHDNRGARRRRWRATPIATGVDRSRRAAMRVLPGGSDHVGGLAAGKLP